MEFNIESFQLSKYHQILIIENVLVVNMKWVWWRCRGVATFFEKSTGRSLGDVIIYSSELSSGNFNEFFYQSKVKGLQKTIKYLSRV